MDGMTPALMTEVRKAIVKCEEWGQILQRIQSCGAECQDQRAEQQMAADFLNRVLTIYGPSFPSKSTV